MTAANAQPRVRADLLWQHWQQRRRMAQLPEAMRPGTREAGYAVQALLDRHTAFPLFGWKIAATSKAGQAHIAVDGPMAGRLLRERVRDNGGRVPFAGNHMRVAEAEFAFRMGADLPPRSRPYGADEVLAAVAALHPAIEVPDSRFEDFTVVGAAQLIADNACADYFVLGPPAPAGWQIDRPRRSPRHRPRQRRPRARGHGRQRPRRSARSTGWLVNELSSLNVTLAAGQVVTTGTCLVPLAVEPGQHVSADFGMLGAVDAWLDA